MNYDTLNILVHTPMHLFLQGIYLGVKLLRNTACVSSTLVVMKVLVMQNCVPGDYTSLFFY